MTHAQELHAALSIAVDHIDMHSLAVSHPKDHAAINAALSELEALKAREPMTPNQIDALIKEITGWSPPIPDNAYKLVRAIEAHHNIPARSEQ